MKITGVKTFIVCTGDNNWLFVKIETDTGISGLGEGSVTSKVVSVEAAIRDNVHLLIGQDPRNIEYLWQRLYRVPRWRGGPVLMSAISAIEIALWDILGKSLNAPIWRLLGGKARERVRMYRHVGGRTPEEAAKQAQQIVAEGFTAMKTGPFVTPDNVVRPVQGIEAGVARVQAIREAVGEEVDIMLDAHGQLTPPMAVEVAHKVAPYRPLFLEEPAQIEDLDTLAWIQERSPVPLATGERTFTKWGFADICARHLVSYVQPDVVHCGGISELKKIATLAEAHFIECTPHNPQSMVSTLASLHVDFATPNCVIQEFIWGPPWHRDLFDGWVEIKAGYALPPERPGLGLELNEQEAARHPYREIPRPAWHWPDGSVADY